MSVAVNIQAPDGRERRKIDVDKLKNVPSFAIFYWFLLSAVNVSRKARNEKFVAESMKHSSSCSSIHVAFSVHPTSENNFTAFLCRWKIAMKMINRNCSRKGFYDAELPPNPIPFQLALPFVRQEKVLSFVNSNEVTRTFLD